MLIRYYLKQNVVMKKTNGNILQITYSETDFTFFKIIKTKVKF